MKLVRLYPYDKKRGHVLRTYLDPELGLKFVGKRGWYEVSEEVAEAIEDVRQKHSGVGAQRSGPAFMIADNNKAAKKMDKELAEEKGEDEDVVGTADAPVRARPGSKADGGKPRKRRSRKNGNGGDKPPADDKPADKPDDKPDGDKD